MIGLDILPRWIGTERKRRFRERILSAKGSPPGQHILTIDPSRVKRYTDFDRYNDVGRVVSGDWDLVSGNEIESMPKYVGVYQRFVEGRDWEETAIFGDNSYLIRNIRNGDGQEDCETQEELMERYRTIDSLFESIMKNGFRDERVLSGNKYDLVAINIGRDGELIFNRDGWHRLSIAKHFDFDRIPVQVVVRHQQWQSLRKLVADSDTVDELPAIVRHNLSHPDLQDVLPESTERKSTVSAPQN